MSTSTKAILAICFAAFVAGCAPKQEEVVFVEEPVSTEPTYTGKYK